VGLRGIKKYIAFVEPKFLSILTFLKFLLQPGPGSETQLFTKYSCRGSKFCFS
jgi:hypothetical protein